MRNKLVIVIDLGCLKAHRVEYDGVSTHPRLELIEEFNTVGAHGRLSDKLTDEAGRFGGGELRPGSGGNGERHNLTLELDKRIITYLAGSVNELVKREDADLPVYLAAEKEICHPLLERLEPAVKGRIAKVVPENLTKVNRLKLLNHFGIA
ncbi:MAG: hypothetical protein JWR69_702 [Pedosphaera sp.]|nr:hypothetical protein [Pedosphaera sp.]